MHNVRLLIHFPFLYFIKHVACMRKSYFSFFNLACNLTSKFNNLTATIKPARGRDKSAIKHTLNITNNKGKKKKKKSEKERKTTSTGITVLWLEFGGNSKLQLSNRWLPLPSFDVVCECVGRKRRSRESSKSFG